MIQLLSLYDEPQDYARIQKIMHDLHGKVVGKKIPGAVIITRYNPIKTTGLTGTGGTDFVKDTRGGGDTFHDEGQVVVYPILPLDFIANCWKVFSSKSFSYSKFLQSWMSLTIEALGFEIVPNQEQFGTWIRSGEEVVKVGFVGGQVKRQVTLHGFAVNLHTSLETFREFKPCGLDEVVIGNLGVGVGEFVKKVLIIFEKMLGFRFKENE